MAEHPATSATTLPGLAVLLQSVPGRYEHAHCDTLQARINHFLLEVSDAGSHCCMSLGFIVLVAGSPEKFRVHGFL